ncbi:unnamed protein product [Caenorhabditis bovis]|uniref:Uncharacterized protein n=1 Tax=Caenorhabditis bovis TaxID=2654633 RepID=A0A8S1EDC5_9PELO|nr:unnamed protein product [Caenorhabditis bovis]
MRNYLQICALLLIVSTIEAWSNCSVESIRNLRVKPIFPKILRHVSHRRQGFVFDIVQWIVDAYFGNTIHKEFDPKVLLEYSTALGDSKLWESLQMIAQFDVARNGLRYVLILMMSYFILLCYIIVNRLFIFSENRTFHRFHHIEYIYVPILLITTPLSFIAFFSMCDSLQNYRINVKEMTVLTNIVIDRYFHVVYVYFEQLDCIVSVYGLDKEFSRAQRNFDSLIRRTTLPWKLFKNQLAYLETFYHICVSIPYCIQLNLSLITIATFCLTALKTERQLLLDASTRFPPISDTLVIRIIGMVNMLMKKLPKVFLLSFFPQMSFHGVVMLFIKYTYTFSSSTIMASKDNFYKVDTFLNIEFQNTSYQLELSTMDIANKSFYNFIKYGDVLDIVRKLKGNETTDQDKQIMRLLEERVRGVYGLKRVQKVIQACKSIDPTTELKFIAGYHGILVILLLINMIILSLAYPRLNLYYDEYIYADPPELVFMSQKTIILSFNQFWQEEEAPEAMSFEEDLPEKYRGQRRWLGKEHHSRKAMLYNQVKDHQLLEKTIKNQENMDQKIVENAAKKCNDDLELNDCGELLKCAPIDQPAEVVEKNFLRQYGTVFNSTSTFALHEKKNEDEAGFEIRTASTSSGRGQHYSNFSEKNRELSKKGGQKEEELATEPVIQYNIYKAQRSKDVVGDALFQFRYKTQKENRNRRKIIEEWDFDEDYDDYDDQDYEDVNVEEGPTPSSTLNFDDLIVEKVKQMSLKEANRKKHEKTEPIEKKAKFGDEMSLKPLMERDNGYTFHESCICFSKIDGFEFNNEIEKLRSQRFELKRLNARSVLVDLSSYCRDSMLAVTLNHLSDNRVFVLVNSNVMSHPSIGHLNTDVRTQTTLANALIVIARNVEINREIIRLIREQSIYQHGCANFKDLRSEKMWNNVVNMRLPFSNRHESWANCDQLMANGFKQRWRDVRDILRDFDECDSDDDGDFDAVLLENCQFCCEKRQIFRMENGDAKCRQCLNRQFCREFREKRLPIQLKVKGLKTVDILPSIVPMPIVIEYYKCLETPHSPMTCEQFKKWNRKWIENCELFNGARLPFSIAVIYTDSLATSQGQGDEAIVEIRCKCLAPSFRVRLPCEQVECPKCHVIFDPATMEKKKVYIEVKSPRMRKLLFSRKLPWNKDPKLYSPGSFYVGELPKLETFKIKSIAHLPQAIVEVCKDARTARLDEKANKKVRKLAHNFGAIENDIVRAMQSVPYLVEFVNAWMFMSGNHDKVLEKKLRKLGELREALWNELEANSDNVRSTQNQLKSDIEKLITMIS